MIKLALEKEEKIIEEKEKRRYEKIELEELDFDKDLQVIFQGFKLNNIENVYN